MIAGKILMACQLFDDVVAFKQLSQSVLFALIGDRVIKYFSVCLPVRLQLSNRFGQQTRVPEQKSTCCQISVNVLSCKAILSTSGMPPHVLRLFVLGQQFLGSLS